MATKTDAADVETVEPTAEVDEVEATADAPKAAKVKKEPARGDLPEGFVTPIGFAKILSEKGLQKDRAGEVVKDVRPQMVYSYIKNAPKDDAFPLEDVTDSIGKTRSVVNIEKGLDWWTRKNDRTEARKTNAAAKEAKKAEKAAAKAAEPADAAAETNSQAVEAE